MPHSSNMGLSYNVKKPQTCENEYSYKSFSSALESYRPKQASFPSLGLS